MVIGKSCILFKVGGLQCTESICQNAEHKLDHEKTLIVFGAPVPDITFYPRIPAVSIAHRRITSEVIDATSKS